MAPSRRSVSSFDRRTFLRGNLTGGAALWLGAGLLRPGIARSEDLSSHLIVRSEDPPNAEPALDALVKNWITPAKYLYVRSHAATPMIDADAFRLEVSGLVHRPSSIGLAELKDSFRKVSVDATLTCAGNRRTEFNAIKPVGGVQWEAGAIGNAHWGGALLSQVLRRAELKDGAKHVWFEGLDEVKHGDGIIPFGGSISIDKAMSDTAAMPGALVVYEMNDEPLTPDHGFPLRAIVPGYIGARSVKWLGKIVVSDRPSPNHYQQGAYKLVTDDTDDAWQAAAPLEQYPLNSVICVPSASAQLRDMVQVQGYALAQGIAGRTIAHVQLSTDGGNAWTDAKLLSPAKPFCWQLWQAELPIKQDTAELIVRATDSTGEMQPERIDWNLKGYMYNAWHRVPIRSRS